MESLEFHRSVLPVLLMTFFPGSIFCIARQWLGMMRFVFSQAARLARHEHHDSIRSAASAQLRRVHAAELAHGDRGKLPLDQLVSQLDARRRRAPIDGLLPAAQPSQGTARSARLRRLPHCRRRARRRPSWQNQVRPPNAFSYAPGSLNHLGFGLVEC